MSAETRTCAPGPTGARGLLVRWREWRGARRQAGDRPLYQAAIDAISAIFLPIVNVLSAAGILKGTLAAAVLAGWLADSSPAYVVCDAIASALFYFLPVFLASTTAALVGADRVTAVLLAAVVLYPDLSAARESGQRVTFFGAPVGAVTYPSSVIPILLGVLVLAGAERVAGRCLPEVVRGPLVPLVSLVVAAGGVLVVLGPVGSAIGQGLAQGYGWVHSLSPVLAGATLGGLIQLMVLFGFHWALVPIAISNIVAFGSDTILAFFAPAVFAQAGACLAVCLRTKNRAYRTVCVSAAISACFGITEPAMFGVTLPLRKPLAAVCVAGAVGGGVAGASGAAAMSFAFPGLTTLPIFLGPGFGMFTVGCLGAAAIAFVLTLVMRFDADAVARAQEARESRED